MRSDPVVWASAVGSSLVIRMRLAQCGDLFDSSELPATRHRDSTIPDRRVDPDAGDEEHPDRSIPARKLASGAPSGIVSEPGNKGGPGYWPLDPSKTRQSTSAFSR